MKEGKCGGKARHPAVVAADMQPREDMTFGDEVTDCRCLVAFGRAMQGDRPRPVGQRAGEVSERRHTAPPPVPSPASGGGLGWELLKERRRRVTSWSWSGGGIARRVIQSKRSASAHSSNVS